MNTKNSFLLFFLIVFFDQFTKYLVKASNFPTYYNYGISFGLLANSNFAKITQTVVYLILLIVVGYLVVKKPKAKVLLTVFTLLLAGGAGNSIDRLLNNGGVIDFIRLGKLPVFNVADLSVTIGVLLFSYYELKPK
ncbi:signal peptidase II [Candidatus Gottesmanbacteria bacterium]|nr:signal peptidase II [Candidatus Gottesmanbacteria bacterium]